MIFKIKKHNFDLYNTLLHLSRNLYFYRSINLKDCFETRIYLMFMHFSIILIIHKEKKINFSQKNYDSLFNHIENNLRENGLGDIAVNQKMKNLNKIFYDILLKIKQSNNNFQISKKLAFNYFPDLNDEKFKLFDLYFISFYNFCFELNPDNMIKEAIKFNF